MKLTSGLAGALGGYTDPSIYVDHALAVNGRDPASILGGFHSALVRVLTAAETEALYASDPNYPHPLRLVEQLTLPGFTLAVWQEFSIQENKMSKRYREVGDRLLSETLLRIAIQNFSGQTQALYLESFLIGDFIELRQIINVITSADFHIPGIEISWKAFCPDPHEIYDTQLKAALSLPGLKFPAGTLEGTETHITASFPEYDNYLGSKWFCGLDGSGLLNDDNLRWLAGNQNTKSLLVIGSLHRPNYLDDSPSMVDLYFRLCLGMLAATAPRGVAVIKISLPVNRALLGVYSLFAIFFNRVRIVKFKQHPLDDDTVYLIGSENLGIPPELFAMLLQSPNSKNSILEYLSRQTTPIYTDLNRVLGDDLQAWISKMEEIWNVRNM